MKSYIFRVVEKDITLNGSRKRFHIVDSIPATRVIAVDGDDLILIRQKRPKIGGRKFIEAPGGSIDRKLKETPMQNAVRELMEETGIDAKKVSRLAPARYTKDPGLGSGTFQFFLAKDLLETKVQHLDGEESIDVIRLKLKQAVKMVENGEIDDLGTAFGILYYNQFKSRK